MSERRTFLSGLSTFQLLAGALAAMTSAWVASFLGVGGTLIGAALGSLVLSVSSALYSNTLDKGRTLVVQTTDGNVVRTEVEEGQTAEALAEVEEETGSTVTGAEVVDEEDEGRSGPPWRRIAVSTVVVFLVAVVAMGAYELVTGESYGGDSDNTRIVDPFGGSGGGSGSGSGDGQQQDQQDDGSDTDPGSGDTDPSVPDEQEQEEDVTPTPTPTPTQAPTPTPVPTRTPAPTTPAE